jgi:hypothetical protein
MLNPGDTVEHTTFGSDSPSDVAFGQALGDIAVSMTAAMTEGDWRIDIQPG